MKILISGHRLFKLKNYSISWIKSAIEEAVNCWIDIGMGVGLSGMASGCDLWFCEILITKGIPFIACPPFEEQAFLMENSEESTLREKCLEKASQIKKIRNSTMVEMADGGIIVWDGNKGGTHNVIQQMVEKNKRFIWINPIGEKIWKQF